MQDDRNVHMIRLTFALLAEDSNLVLFAEKPQNSSWDFRLMSATRKTFREAPGELKWLLEYQTEEVHTT